MPCSSCGEELLPGKPFCHSCGAPAGPICPSCGSPVKAEFAFCPDCGSALAGAPARTSSPTTTEPLRIAAVEVPPPTPLRSQALPGPISGERKEVTVLFCDLAGSTALASGLDPEECRELLDLYLELAG